MNLRQYTEQGAMFTAYLAYAPLSPKLASHRHLMVRQLMSAASRAVLSDLNDSARARGPRARLLVSAHVNLLSIVLAIAKNYAAFVEPEGEERLPPPLYAVRDGVETEDDDVDGQLRIAPWLHPARIDAPLSVEEALLRHRPTAVIVAGDGLHFLERWKVRMEPHMKQRAKLIYFPMFSVDGGKLPPDLEAEVIDGEALMAERMASRLAETKSLWDSSLAEGEEIDLEPYFPFGAAIEHAIWSAQRDGGGEVGASG